MQIIKLGDCHAAPIYKFHCPLCNCIYLSAEWELQYSAKDANPELLYRQCPGCGNKISALDAKLVNIADLLAKTVYETEYKSETTENGCENCAHLGTREDSSKFCMIPGKTPSTETCGCYKSIEADIAERAERTKLREATRFIHTYCTNHHNCKGCPFDEGIAEGCALVQIPSDWDTDF